MATPLNKKGAHENPAGSPIIHIVISWVKGVCTAQTKGMVFEVVEKSKYKAQAVYNVMQEIEKYLTPPLFRKMCKNGQIKLKEVEND